MLKAPQQIVSAVALVLTLSAPAQAIDFTLGSSVSVPNDDTPDWGTPDPTTTLFHWGDLFSPKSTREFVYTGSQSFYITGVTVSGDIQSTYDASGQDPDYGFTSFVAAMGLQMQVTKGGTPGVLAYKDFDDTDFFSTDLSASTPYTRPFGEDLLFQLSDRVITPGASVQLGFYSNFNFSAPNDLPSVVYTGPTIEFIGTPLADGNLSIAPDPLVFDPARAGTTGTQTLSTVLTNTGGPGTLLLGTAGTGTGAFSGGGTAFELENGETQSVSYGFQAEATPSTVPTTQSVDVAGPGGSLGTIHLSGQTVGPLFDFSGADVTGATVNLAAEEGLAVLSQELLIRNVFASHISDALTSLSILNIGLDSGDADFALFDLMGYDPLDPDPIVAAGGGTPFGFRVNFLGAAAGIYEIGMLIETDQGAAFGEDGLDIPLTIRVVVDSSVPVPLPGTWLLMGAGLIGLRRAQLRRN